MSKRLMRCIKPQPMEVKGERLFIPCGKCNFCLQNRRNEWAFRLHWHLSKDALTADFLTLTYNEANLPTIREEGMKATFMNLEKKHLMRFFRTLRQVQRRFLVRWAKKSKMVKVKREKLYKDWKIKYYAVGEYGTKFHRPHYHAIVFNIHPEVMSRLNDGEIWTKGVIHRGDVNDSSIQYTAKYVIDAKRPDWEHDPRTKPFSIMSMGLGKSYIARRGNWHKQGLKLYVMSQGNKTRMPRYYKDKIFTEDERRAAGEQAATAQEELEAQELDKLIEEFKGDEVRALQMYMHRLWCKHDQIRVKSNQLNKQ